MHFQAIAELSVLVFLPIPRLPNVTIMLLPSTTWQFLVLSCPVSTRVLKLSFSQSLSIHNHLSVAHADLLEFDHSVFDSH